MGALTRDALGLGRVRHGPPFIDDPLDEQLSTALVQVSPFDTLATAVPDDHGPVGEFAVHTVVSLPAGRCACSGRTSARGG